MMQAAEEFFADLEKTSEHVSGPPLTDGGGDVDGLGDGRGTTAPTCDPGGEDCRGTGERTEGAVDGLRWVGMWAGLFTTF
jgi:hypothetical protein